MYNEVEKILGTALKKLGISPNIKGYHYICKAVQISMNRQKSRINFSKCLYPEIADCFNVTSPSIERAIRNAIHNGYVHCDRKFAYSIFRNTLQSSADIPTNTLFITSLVQWIQFQWETDFFVILYVKQHKDSGHLMTLLNEQW